MGTNGAQNFPEIFLKTAEISTKRTIPPKLNRKFLVRLEIVENLDTPREVVLVFVNSGRCCSIRELTGFKKFKPDFFSKWKVPMHGLSLARAFYNCFSHYHLVILISI